MNTAIYAVLHFLVDFVCAWAVFGFFRDGPDGYLNLLVYNFCAFALQMPLGTLLDLAGRCGRKHMPLVWTGSGLVLTLAGALLHPGILGLGNALFHVGGGMDVIEEDFARNRKGVDLGLFVAPGAIGLYLGTRLGKSDPRAKLIYIAGGVMLLLLALLVACRPGMARHVPKQPMEQGKKAVPLLAGCCFLVVILRSWIGLEISFQWKGQYGLLAVLAVALGKVLGGLVSVRFGIQRTIRWSLLLSGGCYLLGEITGFGLAALLLFNMSMPVTLYLLAKYLPGLPGFSFGLLTFGLFIGFLPVYAGVQLHIPDPVFGALGSLISLMLLMAAGKAVHCDRVLS